MGKIDFKKIEGRLCLVQKPARYTGGELNSLRKNDVVVRAAISYPDMYEIGMSNNGIKILYELANSVEGAACERVFSAADDFDALLTEENIPLFTLESRTPLDELDLLGFNLCHELLYTNMLRILDLGHIPLLKTERGEGCPIIIAGGSAASNPFPTSDFIDAFFIGDGEDGFVEILASLVKAKREGLSRNQTIELMGNIEGVLLPHLYSFVYDGMMTKTAGGPVVKKRTYQSVRPTAARRPLVPNIRVEHEKAVVDVSRGCYNLCKFCHAGYFELPYRAYGISETASAAREVLANTGYNELSFSSLSIGDYRDLNPLLNIILPELTENGVSVSLPSLKVDEGTIPLIESVSDIRRSSLTFAVESGSEKLRLFAHKNVRESELLFILDHVFGKGWDLIKLYFMIGLPGCGEENEADAIIELLKKIISAGRRKKEVHVTISPFIPKPHTPFQRARQMDEDYFLNTVLKIKQAMPRSVKIKNHNVRSSALEGLFARGDSRLGQVILSAYKNGCRFDSWNEHFNYNIWEASLNELIPRWRESFLEREGALPWQNITTGREKLIEAVGRRSSCVIPGFKFSPEPLDGAALAIAAENFRKKYNVSQTIRVRFSKTGSARFIPHIDFVEIVKRAMRRAGMPMAFTQGFNKRERVIMGPAIPVGIESLVELCDMELYAPCDASGLIALLEPLLPEGIKALDVQNVTPSSPKLSDIDAAVYEVDVNSETYRQKVLANLAAEIQLVKHGKSGEKPTAFHEALLSWTTAPSGILLLTVRAGSLRIDSLMAQLAEAGLESAYGFRMVKTAQLAGNREV
ncbi:MAG: TIGR03960 family B12-binding radical SAM protein [Spirochaetia bacterium]|jgi:radical SAM family uncharacterized protein/radical SAM-linked protein|nr:TIGR03960 family B12-binding radical SAM protein [Spirochaetia bacterium]